ncbi:MAG: tetratricopeptide repeat protein, partial [Caldilineaceae bacterium]
MSAVGHIVPAIAEAIGYLPETGDQSGRSAQAQLIYFLRERKLLLVLDNFEHLLAGADLMDALLQGAPHVRIVTTARERLHLRGEQLFPIQGLDFPAWETPVDAATYTAIQLFVQSARRIQPRFALADTDLPHLTRICRLVEGMPLGIELAAGWVDLLSPAEIAAEIQRSLDFLATEERNVPERQRSIRALFDYSWKRLAAAEQQTFARLALFRGGFTRQAAVEVAGASLHLLSALVSQSLLHYAQATGRYQMHELLRQYAAEKLEDASLSAETRAAHAAYFTSFLRQQETALKGQEHRQAKAAIVADFENVRQGWLWAVENRAYAMLERASEGLFWFLHQDLQRYQAGQALFQSGREGLAPVANEAPHRAWAKMLARVLPYGSGEFEAPLQAKASFEQALTIVQAHGDDAEAAFCQWQLGQAHMILGDLAAAKRAFEESMDYHQRTNDHFYVAWTLKMLGKLSIRQRDPAQAVANFQRSLHLHRKLGMAEVHLLFDLGLALANGLGEFAAAEAHLRRAYQLSQRDENSHDLAGALVYLSRILAAKGDWAEAQ